MLLEATEVETVCLTPVSVAPTCSPAGAADATEVPSGVPVPPPPPPPPYIYTAAVSGVTYYGPLKWFGFFPYDFDGDFSIVWDRYLMRSASGSNTQQTGYFSPDVVYGTILNTFFGEQIVDPLTGVQTGDMRRLSAFDAGLYCRGSSYARTSGLTLTDVTTNALDVLALDNTFVTRSGVITRTLRGWDSGRSAGGVTTYCGISINGINGDQFFESLSDRMTVEQATIAGGGSINTYTGDTQGVSYNDLTGVATGRQSVLTFTDTHPSNTEYMLLDMTFNKVPNGGGATEVLHVLVSVQVGIGGLFSYVYEIPMEIGYTITYVTNVLYNFSELSDDFEQMEDGTFLAETSTNWVSNGVWNDIPTFIMLLPGTECGSDFEDYPPGFIGVAFSTLAGGYYWAGDASFNATDNTQCSDDFESYPTGSVAGLDGGTGFAGIGKVSIFDYSFSKDDFESYAAGTITTLTWQTGGIPDNYWSADGTIGLFDNQIASDDFESYATGTITVLNGGSGWNANGTIY